VTEHKKARIMAGRQKKREAKRTKALFRGVGSEKNFNHHDPVVMSCGKRDIRF